ncbi:MAG: hypothetical protein B5M51_01755 [Anaerolinea sp. 4484_236]|nr:MAG: hypothetical protein B5M51_01755 [Anaerolinea sp. 4484_236]
MIIPISGIEINIDPTALIVKSQHPMQAISSGLINGGIRETRSIINLHVDKGYDSSDPVADFMNLVKDRGYPVPFIGMMTAAYVSEASEAHFEMNGLTVAAITTAGLSNSAAAGLSLPIKLRPGTINTILLVDGRLSSAAMINAVMTATEAKTAALHEAGKKTQDGYPVTGTTTDSIVVACTGRGDLLPYAGTATPIGYLIGRAVRAALKAHLS